VRYIRLYCVLASILFWGEDRAYPDEMASGNTGLDLSGYWRSYSTGFGTKGVKGEVEEKIVVSRLNSNEYLVRTLGGVVRMSLGAGDYWTEGECAGSRKYEDPCVVKVPAGGQARLTVNGATARISWDECPDSLQILGRDRMEGSDACGWRVVYTR
jgi:hypothetical protein